MTRGKALVQRRREPRTTSLTEWERVELSSLFTLILNKWDFNRDWSRFEVDKGRTRVLLIDNVLTQHTRCNHSNIVLIGCCISACYSSDGRLCAWVGFKSVIQLQKWIVHFTLPKAFDWHLQSLVSDYSLRKFSAPILQ